MNRFSSGSSSIFFLLLFYSPSTRYSSSILILAEHVNEDEIVCTVSGSASQRHQFRFQKLLAAAHHPQCLKIYLMTSGDVSRVGRVVKIRGLL